MVQHLGMGAPQTFCFMKECDFLSLSQKQTFLVKSTYSDVLKYACLALQRFLFYMLMRYYLLFVFFTRMYAPGELGVLSVLFTMIYLILEQCLAK